MKRLFPIRRDTAQVYCVGNKRYLSRSGAVRRAALLSVWRKYSCKCEPETGYQCCSHMQYKEFEALVLRVERLIRRQLNAT